MKPLATRSPSDLHGGVRRGEHRGVLQEFGHQVGEVGDGRPGDGDPGQAADLDALVVLDLGDGGADDVHELDGLAPLPRRGGAGEDDQALGVATHARGQVVEAEQVGEFVGVLGPALHAVQQGELLVQQHLAAAGEVDEDLGDAARAVSACLTAASTAARCRVLRAWPTSPISFLSYSRRGRLGLHVDLFAGGEAAHHAGQPHTGRLMGLQAQSAAGRG